MKVVEFGSTARENLLKGIDTLADAVVSTLGPNGRNVVIRKGVDEAPQSTKDGVTVAKAIVLKNEVEELGVELIKQAATKTADKAGDGTTTSTLLAREMVKEGLSYLNNGENAVRIKRDIDSAVQGVLDRLRFISQDISDEKQIKQIATVSANNDEEIGKLIALAIDKVGLDGVVHIEQSKTGDTQIETVEGIQFSRGYKSPYFVTDNATMTSVLNDPKILILDQRLTQVKELLPILEACSAQSKELLIIAEDIDQEALATLIVNKMRGTMKVCAVKAPDFGERRKLILEDIATITGGQVFSKEKGMKLDKFSWDWFGSARTVTVSKETTTIVDGEGDDDAIIDRADDLQKQIDKSTTPYEKEQLQNRLAKFVGGVAIIHVGGATETEMLEKLDRVEDALHATRAAIEEGIVVGGGAALLWSRTNIKDIKGIGAKIVYKACAKPFIQILVNAGYEKSDAQIIAKELVNGNGFKNGYDIEKMKVTNLVKKGIIDPVKVTRLALENAASVAGTILLTECTIVDDESEDKKTSAMDPMQMMGGM